MIYKIIDRHGQTHVGYFMVDANREPRIIKREQYRSRAIAEQRMEQRCRRTATQTASYIVRFVVDADQGQVERYGTEQEARDAMAASMLPAAPGIARAIEVHLYKPAYADGRWPVVPRGVPTTTEPEGQIGGDSAVAP